jgi:hypothetical protein
MCSPDQKVQKPQCLPPRLAWRDNGRSENSSSTRMVCDQTASLVAFLLLRHRHGW